MFYPWLSVIKTIQLVIQNFSKQLSFVKKLENVTGKGKHVQKFY